MIVQNYSVCVPEGNQDSEGYVALVHGQHYTVDLRNDTNLRCNAELFIDGKHQGTWRIPPKGAASIERPAEDSGRFTFYTLGSKEGTIVGLARTSELGLIKVVFTPESSRCYEEDITYRNYVIYGSRSRGYTAGGTGLSGNSSQSFTNAEEIDLDHSQAVTIHLRLVALQKEPRPLPDYSNPASPPV